MYRALLLPLNFRCVALFSVLFFNEQEPHSIVSDNNNN